MINIKIKNGKKEINGRDLITAIKDFTKNDSEFELITKIFNKINSEEELITELNLIKDKTSKASILLCLKVITNSSILELYEVLDRIYEENGNSPIA